MVKRILLVVVLFTFFENSKSQCFSSYATDLVLDSINQMIREDLLKEGFSIERSWARIEFGDYFIFEIVFDSKNVAILSMFWNSESMIKKYKKQQKSSILKLRLGAFRKHVSTHNTLPYNTFEYFNYRFLFYTKKGNSFEHVLYGEYLFLETDKGISIIDKKIEILQDENAVKQKYNSNF